jgi:DnaJ-class molecular chaperone
VRIRVELPERVWVEGDDVHLELPLRLDEAIRGARIVVPTPGGEAVRVSVPPGSDGRSWLRVRGHGLPRRRGTGRGDLLLRPRIVLPETMEGAGETAERVVAAYREDPRAGLSRVFEGPGGGP